MANPRDYLLDRAVPEPNSGCWLWMGELLWNGYGRGCVNGRRVLAHVLSFEVFHGDVPEGKELDH